MRTLRGGEGLHLSFARFLACVREEVGRRQEELLTGSTISSE
ncbi:hypothetical protein [Mesorhizobium sp.]|nr:hypothetical protein [Mesorhizobium sp.]